MKKITYYATSKSNGWNASLSYSQSSTYDSNHKINGTQTDFGAGGGGYSIKSTTDMAWVSNQTELLGGNSVNIIVGNKTDVKGAVIASGSYETITNEDGTQTTQFTDNNNLTLTTKELEYTNLNDFYKTEQKGFSFGTSIGAGTDKGETNLAPQGSTSIGLTSTGEEKEQITKATIGNGNIIIGGKSSTEVDENGNLVNEDMLSGLNRDVNNSQEITKDRTGWKYDC